MRAGLEVAFGLTRNLPGFKAVVPQAQNYMDLELDPLAEEFAERIFDVMQKAVAIHFDLTDMVMLSGPGGVLYGPIDSNPVGSTNWELRTVWDDRGLRY